MNIYKEILKLQEANHPFAIATIIESKGSTPRHIGKMLVLQDGSIIGTIGGGLAEAYVIREAKNAIIEGHSKTVTYTLNSDAKEGIEMHCGGSLTVFIEVVLPSPKLVIIGAGHIGLAVAQLAQTLDYQIVVIDDRKSYANKTLYPMAIATYADPDITKPLEHLDIDANTYLLIFTKDSDEAVLRKVVDKKPAYIGMIGSARKTLKIMERLTEDGYDKENLNKVYAPIGLDIGAETPEEIAISIIGEILKVKNQKSGQSLKEIKFGSSFFKFEK